MNPPAFVPSQPARSNLALWIHAQFVLIGVTTVLLGPILPALAQQWGMHDLQKGYLLFGQYAGSVLGSLLSTRVLPRWGFNRVCAAAMLILCGGLEVFMRASWQVGVVAIFLCGLGMALAIAASNLGVAESNPGRAASALSLLNFSWGIGAVSFPFLFGTLLRNVPLTRLVPTLGLLPIVFAVYFGFVAKPPHHTRAEMRTPVGYSVGSSVGSSLEAWNPKPFVLIALFAFLYVGTECILSGWIASYAKDFSATISNSSAFASTAFWAALLAGRALAPLALRSRSELTMFRLGVLTAFAGTTLLLTTRLVPFLLIGSALAGFGLAALFPIIAAVMSRDLGQRGNRLGGYFFATGNLGGAILPFLVGVISSQTHSLRIGMSLALVAMALLLAMSHAFSQRLAFSSPERA